MTSLLDGVIISCPFSSPPPLLSPRQQLEESLSEFGHPWKLNPGDGAFYGPKVTFPISLFLKPYHLCTFVHLYTLTPALLHIYTPG